jgi:hypothetical protein
MRNGGEKAVWMWKFIGEGKGEGGDDTKNHGRNIELWHGQFESIAMCVCEYIQTEECPCKGLCNVIEMGHRSVAEALSVEIYALSARALVYRPFIAE